MASEPGLNAYHVYVLIDGQSFDAQGFFDANHERIGGHVGCRKRLTGNNVTASTLYWMSDEICTDIHGVEQAIERLLNMVEPVVLSLNIGSGAQPIVQVVQNVRKRYRATGLYIPLRIMQRLTRLGLDVDFDINYVWKTDGDSGR